MGYLRGGKAKIKVNSIVNKKIFSELGEELDLIATPSGKTIVKDKNGIVIREWDRLIVPLSGVGVNHAYGECFYTNEFFDADNGVWLSIFPSVDAIDRYINSGKAIYKKWLNNKDLAKTLLESVLYSKNISWLGLFNLTDEDKKRIITHGAGYLIWSGFYHDTSVSCRGYDFLADPLFGNIEFTFAEDIILTANNGIAFYAGKKSLRNIVKAISLGIKDDSGRYYVADIVDGLTPVFRRSENDKPKYLAIDLSAPVKIYFSVENIQQEIKGRFVKVNGDAIIPKYSKLEVYGKLDVYGSSKLRFRYYGGGYYVIPDILEKMKDLHNLMILNKIYRACYDRVKSVVGEYADRCIEVDDEILNPVVKVDETTAYVRWNNFNWWEDVDDLVVSDLPTYLQLNVGNITSNWRKIFASQIPIKRVRVRKADGKALVGNIEEVILDD